MPERIGLQYFSIGNSQAEDYLAIAELPVALWHSSKMHNEILAALINPLSTRLERKTSGVPTRIFLADWHASHLSKQKGGKPRDRNGVVCQLLLEISTKNLSGSGKDDLQIF